MPPYPSARPVRSNPSNRQGSSRYGSSRPGSPTRPDFRPFLRRAAFALGLLALFAGIALWALTLYLRPEPSDWKPIYQGVDYKAEELPAMAGDKGRMMALRVQLDAPGVEVMMRPIDPDARAEDGQYFLSLPDWERSLLGLNILMNTTMYTPGGLLQSYPGRVVNAVDTVIANGRPSHQFAHSYMLWVDQAKTPHIETTKPPNFDKLTSAVWGVGVQGVAVLDGKVRPETIDQLATADSRTFLGFDAARKQMFLLAFEQATPVTMMEYAVKQGVQFGGMLDSGSATWLILDGDAKGLRPFTGIRGGRPLGPYLGVRARPLP